MFKVVLLGDAKVGKTAMIHRWKTGDFLQDYNPSLGARFERLGLKTGYGEMKMQLWDCGGTEGYQFEKLCSDADGVILMFDVTNSQSYENLKKWKTQFDAPEQSFGRIPFVICANKVDVPFETRVVKSKDIVIHREWKCPCFETSYKSNYNAEKPFVALLRKMTGKEDLTI